MQLRTTCGYCSTGCNLRITLENGRVTSKTPDTDYTVNKGLVCPKGGTMLDHLDASDRATVPLRRIGTGRYEEIDWDTALSEFTARFKDIQNRHGKQAFSFLSTGQITTEEFAFLGALGRFGMEMVHADGNTRQCMATAVVTYKQAFGFDAPPFTYRDFEESDVLVLVGANLVIAHPIMWRRIKMNTHDPEIVVIDPRKTETAHIATQHYAVRPKSDLTLLYGIASILIERGWIDHRYIEGHTTGFADFSEHVRQFSMERVVRETGLTSKQVEKLARTIHDGKRVSFYWTMGVNQSHQGVRTAEAIVNLCLITGNIGRPGTGPNSVTGQCNAMGSRLFSNTTSLLGGRDFGDPRHRREVADVLDIDEALIPREAGWAYDRILQGVREGAIRGLWIIATNPLHSWISKDELVSTFAKLDYLVVQDMYHSTDTARIADLILPAAGCGEKEGTFINSERRFGPVKKVLPPPGEAKPDFEIFHMIARAWGCGEMFSRWSSPEAAFGILKELSRGRPCDFTGIRDLKMIEEEGGVQWPFPEGAELTDNERRLFADGRYFTDDGKAHIIFEDVVPMPEITDEEYPFLLLTGRGTVAQWHTQTRTGKVEKLKRIYPQELYVEINPEDAESLAIENDQWVLVSSRRAQVRARAAVKDTVHRGEVFMPMHYFETNRLTFPAFDPYSREPAYKMGAVTLSRAH